MKKEIADKWVAALRSGDYKQGKDCLRDANDNFCCLGVLCDLYSEDMAGRWLFMKRSTYLFHDGVFNSSELLPRTVMAWAGIASDSGEVKIYNEALSSMNDDGISFDELADIIEQNYEGL